MKTATPFPLNTVLSLQKCWVGLAGTSAPSQGSNAGLSCLCPASRSTSVEASVFLVVFLAVVLACKSWPRARGQPRVLAAASHYIGSSVKSVQPNLSLNLNYYIE